MSKVKPLVVGGPGADLSLDALLRVCFPVRPDRPAVDLPLCGRGSGRLRWMRRIPRALRPSLRPPSASRVCSIIVLASRGRESRIAPSLPQTGDAPLQLVALDPAASAAMGGKGGEVLESLGKDCDVDGDGAQGFLRCGRTEPALPPRS